MRTKQSTLARSLASVLRSWMARTVTNTYKMRFCLSLSQDTPPGTEQRINGSGMFKSCEHAFLDGGTRRLSSRSHTSCRSSHKIVANFSRINSYKIVTNKL
ncbi:unnamed protein product [Ixodes pacificus]